MSDLAWKVFRPDSGTSAWRSGRRFEAGSVLAAIGFGLVLGLLDPRSAFAVSAAVLTVSVTLAVPSLGLSILVVTVPVQDAWPATIGGMSLTWSRLTLICFLAAWLCRLAIGRDRLHVTPPDWAFAVLLLALTASVSNAQNIGAWGAETYRWAVAAIVFVVATSVLRTTRDRSFLLCGLSAGIVGSLAVAGYQVATVTGPDSFVQRGWLRAYALFGEPNPFAGYLAIATLPVLAIGLSALTHEDRPERFGLASITLAISGAGIVALTLTQSRGGALGFASGVAIIVWFLWPRWGRAAVVSGIIAVLVLMWTPPMEPARSAFGVESALRNRPAQVTAENFAAQERLAHWGAAWRMWSSEPWLGIGAGNYPDRFREHTTEWRFRISRGHAHSAYLQAAAQAGIAGLISYAALLIAVWRHGLRGLDHAMSRQDRAFAVGALAVTGAIVVHGIFDYLHVLGIGIALSALWALPTSSTDVRMDDR